MTLKAARDILRTQVMGGGAPRCPCCGQTAKVYKRALPSATARVMIALYRAGATNGTYVFLPDLLDGMKGTPHQGGYGTLAHFWGLMEVQPGERADGSKRVGWWRLTPQGVAFVEGRARAPKFARLYAQRCLGFTGEPITIRDALGNKFDYNELMSS
jgi:hypothetical protein